VTPGSQTAMTLDQDFTIYSLTVNDSNAVTINSGAATHTLTISGAAGTGIDVQSGAGLFTLNANLTLAGSSDTINVSNSAGAVITGLLNAANGLIKTGTGTLTLTAQNTYTTGTTVNGGTLQIGDGANTATLVAATGALTSMAGGLGGTSVTVDNGSTLNVMAHATVTGGTGGAGAVGLNTGAFGALGGVGSNGGDGGSAAVFLLGGSLSVSGGMSGGTGGVGGQGGGGGFGAPGAGDGGVGGVAGGGGAGGDAVVFSSGGSLTGSGSITGGSGGSGGRGGIGGAD
jgi:autotransporter-associated beta strand protein